MHPRVQFLLIKISLWASIYIEPFAGLVVKNYSSKSVLKLENEIVLSWSARIKVIL